MLATQNEGKARRRLRVDSNAAEAMEHATSSDEATAAEAMEIDMTLAKDPATRQLLEKRVADWKKSAARYRSEPETREGTVELAARAIEAGKKRDLYAEKYHHFEIASAAFQIGIVLASVFLITHVVYMLWGAGLLAGLGVLFTLIGLFFPSAVHLF